LPATDLFVDPQTGLKRYVSLPCNMARWENEIKRISHKTDLFGVWIFRHKL